MIICRAACEHRKYSVAMDATVCELPDIHINAKGKCTDCMRAILCGQCAKWGTDDCPYLLTGPSEFALACSAIEVKQTRK